MPTLLLSLFKLENGLTKVYYIQRAMLKLWLFNYSITDIIVIIIMVKFTVI